MVRLRSSALLLLLTVACASAPSLRDGPLEALPAEPPAVASQVVEPAVVPEPEPEPEPPPITRDLAGAMAEEGGFSELLAALEKHGLTASLAGEEARTLLAPTDEALARLTKRERQRLFGSPAAVQALLGRHTLAGVHPLAELREGDAPLTAVDGSTLAREGGAIEGAALVRPDLVARNGLVHGIDRVLPAPSRARAPARASGGKAPAGGEPAPAPAPKPALAPEPAPGG